MNATQEKITNGFTISHARQTIETLIERTVELHYDSLRDEELYDKLRTINEALNILLPQVKEVEKLINNIDNENI